MKKILFATVGLLIVVFTSGCSGAVADDTEKTGAYHVTCYAGNSLVFDEYFEGFKLFDNTVKFVKNTKKASTYGFSQNMPCVAVWEWKVDVKKIRTHKKYGNRNSKTSETDSVY